MGGSFFLEVLEVFGPSQLFDLTCQIFGRQDDEILIMIILILIF